MVNHAPSSSLFFSVTQLSPISGYTVCWYAAWYKKSISQFIVPLVANCSRFFSSGIKFSYHWIWKYILLSWSTTWIIFLFNVLFFSFCCCCCCCCCVVVVVVVVVFFFVELCRPVLYDVRTQSSFIAGGGSIAGGGGGGRSILEGSYGFQGGWMGISGL